jgi:hypothetical protein
MLTGGKSMLRHEEHPSDETLLRGIDSELSIRDQTALDQHLSRCEHCGVRRSELESIAGDLRRMCRREISTRTVDAAALRARIQTGMAELGAALDRSWWWRLRRGILTVPLAARVVVSVALVVFMLQWTWPRGGIIPSWSTPAAPIATEGLPIRALTPGMAVDVSIDTLCAGQPAAREPIPPSLRQAVLRQYRMEQIAEHEYELDYLITPELGGVADQRNLWPERYTAGVWNARVKDDLEELLPQLVCRGTLALSTAQRDIATDWIAAYKKYFRTAVPIDRDAHLFAADDEPIAPRRGLSRQGGHVAGARPSPFLPLRVSLVAFQIAGTRSDDK